MTPRHDELLNRAAVIAALNKLPAASRPAPGDLPVLLSQRDIYDALDPTTRPSKNAVYRWHHAAGRTGLAAPRVVLGGHPYWTLDQVRDVVARKAVTIPGLAIDEDRVAVIVAAQRETTPA